MTLSDRIQELLNENHLSQSELEKILGFGKGTITKWKGTTVPSADKLLKISEYFGVSLDYLMTGKTNGSAVCKGCGLAYDPDNATDLTYHQQVHADWEKAVEKFGDLYCNYAENEKIKAKCRNICNDSSLPLNERYDAQLLLLRCMFSRSVEANHFSLTHVAFEEYVSMMLNNENYTTVLDTDLRKMLTEKYGVMPGLSSGVIYHMPREPKAQTIAAHFDGDDYTPNELEEISRFAEFVKQRRKK